jgi:hypothetical protein
MPTARHAGGRPAFGVIHFQHQEEEATDADR